MTGTRSENTLSAHEARPDRGVTSDPAPIVLLVANWLDDLGGVQTATRALADALSLEGVRVRVVSVFAPSEPSRRRSATLWGKTPSTVLPARMARGLSDTRWGRLDRAARARAIRRLETCARGAEAVIAMDVFAAELLADARTPLARRVFQYHNTFTNIDGTRDLQRVQRVAGSIDAMAALTDHDAEGFRKHVGIPVHAIPNIQASGRRGAVPRERLVVGLGRYTAAKNFSLLLRAWADLPQARQCGWRLELHGDGPERAMLEELAPAGATVGQRSDAVQELLARAAILVLPSQYEGLPMVLLEAMAAGVACVATRSGPGVEELLEGDAGWLVERDDRNALVEAIVEAVGDQHERERRIDLADRRLARFSPAVVTARWRRLLSAEGVSA